MEDISKLNKTELRDLLKQIKLFEYLKRSLWKRWILEFEKISYWKKICKIEYSDFWDTSLAYYKAKSVKLFNDLYWLNITETEISFVSNKNLIWWIRIFFNDNMFDLSYKRFEKLMK